MYKIELGGGCFKHDMEQTIILWFSSKSEFSSLNDFIQFCWIKQHTEANYGRQSLEEWFAEFHIEDICPETFDKKIQEYTSDLYHAEIRGLIERCWSMESDIEYIQLFMAYESDDMPVIYFYEVDLKDNRFVLREMEVFADRTVKIENDFYRDVIEVCSIPTVDEFNAKVWGEGFYATIISKEEFDEIWNTRNYGGSLDAI